MRRKFLFITILSALISYTFAQVKIGNTPGTINTNSLLELESTNKGFLPPRVALNAFGSVAPLTGTVPAGMLVFSSGGTLPNGFYYWNGAIWVPFISTGVAGGITSKSASATLAKSETFVIASGDITLTFPAITAADDGLTMVVKNVGTHVHEVDVIPNGSSTIDGLTISKHYRWMAKTYVASGGDWIIKEKEGRIDNVFEVSATGSWTTIAEVMGFLNAHMTGPSIVKLSGGSYPITATQTINLPHTLTIQGSSYGTATILASGGVSGSLFNCQSESYFKMLAFDANAVSIDAIHLDTNLEYYEVKDCTFDAFDKAIVALTNVELWVFEVDILNAGTAGIELAAGANAGVSFKISETDFIDCAIGIHFLTGTEAIISILNCGFYNPAGTGDGIKYVPGASTTFTTMFITNNTWNNEGTFMNGFDFADPTGRDANAFIRNNSGSPDRNPHCRINVMNNATSTNIILQNTWYKGNWGTQTSDKTKWAINNAVVNKITYQPVNKSDCWSIITGNVTASNANETIVIAIVKKGISTDRYGETELKIVTSGAPYQFATSIYITDISPGDFFEIWVFNKTSSADVTFNDVQWFTETK